MGVYFLAGIYGVGKSTLGNELSRQMNMPFFSAGDLISEVNGETYGANKVVANKSENQSILAQRVRQLLVKHPKILLAGHFCIVNSMGKVDPLPKHVFGELSIEKIVLLEADATQIADHLSRRDGRQYPTELIEQMAETEREMAYSIAARLPCAVVQHHMAYSETDAAAIISKI